MIIFKSYIDQIYLFETKFHICLSAIRGRGDPLASFNNSAAALGLITLIFPLNRYSLGPGSFHHVQYWEFLVFLMIRKQFHIIFKLESMVEVIYIPINCKILLHPNMLLSCNYSSKILHAQSTQLFSSKSEIIKKWGYSQMHIKVLRKNINCLLQTLPDQIHYTGENLCIWFCK